MFTDLSHVRLDTSSWAYERWQGLVYQRTYPKSRFSQDTLAEYASYAEQVPEHFRFCSNVWEEITTPAHANLPRKPGLFMNAGARCSRPKPARASRK
jgi:uncharacterized protein YecE (DUF72 family)